MADNRVTNEARREAPRPVPAPLDRGPKISQRIERSPFQRLLDGLEEPAGPVGPADFGPASSPGPKSASEIREAVRPVLSQQERYGRDKDDFQKKIAEGELDRESGSESKTGGSQGTGAAKAREAERRVIARGAVSEHKGQGKGGGGQQGQAPFGQGKKGLEFLHALRGKLEGKGIRKGGAKEPGEVRFALAMETGPARESSVAKSKTAGFLSKALLDQIVQYCRLVTKTDSDKEFDIKLHDDIFKGLRLKVTLVQGKMEVTFLTGSQEVMGLFQTQKGELQKTLSEKGIEVRSINVTMV